MSINRTGFKQTNFGVEIEKDTVAQLIYTFDWREWLDQGDTVSTVAYDVAARRNDPTPVSIITEGVSESTKTYVELAGGQEDKTYVVTADITTANGLRDRRNFKLKVVTRRA